VLVRKVKARELVDDSLEKGVPNDVRSSRASETAGDYAKSFSDPSFGPCRYGTSSALKVQLLALAQGTALELHIWRFDIETLLATLLVSTVVVSGGPS